jgi:hypothetical protein
LWQELIVILFPGMSGILRIGAIKGSSSNAIFDTEKSDMDGENLWLWNFNGGMS